MKMRTRPPFSTLQWCHRYTPTARPGNRLITSLFPHISESVPRTLRTLHKSKKTPILLKMKLYIQNKVISSQNVILDPVHHVKTFLRASLTLTKGKLFFFIHHHDWGLSLFTYYTQYVLCDENSVHGVHPNNTKLHRQTEEFTVYSYSKKNYAARSRLFQSGRSTPSTSRAMFPLTKPGGRYRLALAFTQC